MTTPSQHSSMQAISETSLTPRSSVLLAAYWLTFIMSSLFFPAFAVGAIPAFEEVFLSFGSDLPFLTRAVINCRFALFLLPLIAATPAVLLSLSRTFERNVYKKYKQGLLALLLALCGIAAVLIVAMYLPILNLGEVL